MATAIFRPSRRQRNLGPIEVQCRVAGNARLVIQVTAPRYTIAKVVDGLNAGSMVYTGGRIFKDGVAVAKYHIQEIDDHLADFRAAS